MNAMMRRFFLGPAGAESDRRLVRQMLLCFVWIVVALVETYATGQTPGTRILSWFWGACLVLWTTIAAFGVRVYLDQRRVRRLRRSK